MALLSSSQIFMYQPVCIPMFVLDERIDITGAGYDAGSGSFRRKHCADHDAEHR